MRPDGAGQLFPEVARNTEFAHVSIILMKARLPHNVILLLAVGLTVGVPAQVAPESRPAKEAAPAAPKQRRAISPEIAHQLRAMTPNYTPPAPKPAPKPDEEQVDLRDIDKPRNGIVRLPKYIVQEPKTPVLSERAITTDKGLADIAVRRYISEVDRALNRFTLPLFGTSMEARALQMYAEAERLKNMSDLADNANTVSKSDPAAGEYVRREAQKTYMRTSDFGWSSGEPR
jgi:hypothetical protein